MNTTNLQIAQACDRAGEECTMPREVAGEAPEISVYELADWASERWHAEVKNRPMVNVHRRALDDTWRQVLRRLGIDDRARLGPTHDELRAEITTREWEAMNGKPAAPIALAQTSKEQQHG